MGGLDVEVHSPGGTVDDRLGVVDEVRAPGGTVDDKTGVVEEIDTDVLEWLHLGQMVIRSVLVSVTVEVECHVTTLVLLDVTCVSVTGQRVVEV